MLLLLLDLSHHTDPSPPSLSLSLSLSLFHARTQIVRDAFGLAREKITKEGRAGAIIFIDEIDAVGAKRGGSDGGSAEVQRTMLELLNQLDGFTSNDTIKVIAATNRPDILDPALLRSGRLDRKIEMGLPTEVRSRYH